MTAKLRLLVRFAPVLWIAASVGLAQTTPRRAATPAPAVSPTNPVPESALTPGSGALTPGSGPLGGRTDIYGIPPTTPAGMPAYTITGTSSPGAHTDDVLRPVSATDCAGDAWRRYTALEFKTRQNCESWVMQHPGGQTGAGGMGTPSGTRSGTAMKKATPSPRRTAGPRARAKAPVAATPSPATTPAAR